MNALVISLTLCFLDPPLVATDGIEPRACVELATYDSLTECEIKAVGVRVMAKGARLKCRPRELSPDEKRAIAIAEGRWLP